MVARPVFLFIGNSITDGVAALVSDVPSATMTRWTGAIFSPTTYPAEAVVPGVQMWTPKLPYSIPDSRSIDALPAGDQVNCSGADFAATDVDRWVYIKSNATGQGQHRQITAQAPGAIITVSSAFSPALTASGTIELLTDSHTLSGVQTSTVLEKSATTTAFSASDVGRWVVVISGSGVNQFRRITAQTATTITVDDAFTTVPAAGDGICVLTGTDTVSSIATYLAANGEIRDLTLYYDNRLALGTGFDYPNFLAFPWASPFVYKSLYRINYVPELTWQLRNTLATPVYGLVLGVSSSTLSPTYIGATLHTSTFSWAHDVTHNDWHPSSETGHYSVLTAALTAMEADIVAAGDTMDVRGIFTTLAENDASDEQRAARYGVNMKLLRDTLRTYIADAGMSAKKASDIPWINAGIGPTAHVYKDTVNAALAQLAEDDPYTGYVEIDSTYVYEDGVHYDAASQILLGQSFYTEWERVRERAFDATRATAELPTLASIRTKVRNRFERSDSANDTRSAMIDQFINDSLREIHNTLGDNAWFLRRVETLTLSSVYPDTLTMPYCVKRLLRVENTTYPGKQIDWKGVSLTSSGRLQLALHDYSGGPFVCHFIALPQDLSLDGDLALVPNDYIELVVMLTCKRLAESIGNGTIAGYYASETERLWRYVKKDVLRYDRMRQESMTYGGYDTARNAGFENTAFWEL